MMKKKKIKLVLNLKHTRIHARIYTAFSFFMFVYGFFQDSKKVLPDNKKKTQLKIDNQIMASFKKGDLMKQYLSEYWTVVPGQPPHAIKF